MTPSNCIKANSTLAVIVSLGIALVLPQESAAGSLQPPGPPASTSRTLESLGFDCPNDAPKTTNLLYTYVTNVGGADTAITISNTGLDPFGTIGKTSSCTINFYGTSAPAPVSTGIFAPGETYTALASNIAPGFAGYAIARCNFPYAHGLGVINDIGMRTYAMTYLGQVICADRGRNAMGAGR